MRERFHSDIPVLGLDQVFVYRAVKQSLSFCNLIRKTCGGQNLRQQRVGIKSDRREHLIELFRAVSGRQQCEKHCQNQRLQREAHIAPNVSSKISVLSMKHFSGLC